MRRKTIIILALALVFALMFTACAVRRPLQTPVQPRQNTTGQYNNNRGIGAGTGIGPTTGMDTGTGTYTGMGPGYSNPYDVGYYGYNNTLYGGYGNDFRNVGLNNTGTATTQADSIEKSLEQMVGVDNATVVVNGNTAYVGVDTDGDLTGRNISYGNATDLAAVKRSCAQRVRSTNPQIQTVYVSTDANFFDRLRKVGDGVKGGSPVSGFTNELSTLIRGLTPERQ